MPIFRVRRYSGVCNGKNYYHHADIEAPREVAALEAARKKKLNNWREIHSFGKSMHDFEKYEVLYTVSKNEAEDPFCLR